MKPRVMYFYRNVESGCRLPKMRDRQEHKDDSISGSILGSPIHRKHIR